MLTYTTRQGDVLDALVMAHYGSNAALPVVLAANVGLADQPQPFTAGVAIHLPPFEAPAAEASESVRLWG